MTVTVAGNVFFAIMDFYISFLKKALGLALIEKISQPLEAVFHHSAKHLRDTLLPTFLYMINSPLGV